MIESNVENLDRIVSSAAKDFPQLENVLRPKTLKEYVGQEDLKKNLSIALKAAKKRGDSLDHILLHGPPGLGKTTLASVIAYEFGVDIKITSGPALDKPGDIASIISNLKEGDVLFIDEIHRLKPVVEEVLYTAMEDFGIDIIIGKGPSARSMRINLPKFTLIGATTKLSSMSSPLRSRFGSLFKLNFYTDKEIKDILLRSANILECKLGQLEAEKLASCCRKTPRIANRLLRRVRDYADVHNDSRIDLGVLEATLTNLGVDNLGLDQIDREILESIIGKFNGGPVGLNTLAASLSEERATIEDIYEPYLIQLGMLDRTARGRIATPAAYDHMGIEFNK